MKTRYAITAKAYDKRGRLLGVGCNSYTKTHPLQAHFAKMAGEPYRKNLHAEIAAILKVGDKKIHKLQIFRFDKEDRPALSAPCKTCQEAIRAYGIKKVEYSL